MSGSDAQIHSAICRDSNDERVRRAVHVVGGGGRESVSADSIVGDIMGDIAGDVAAVIAQKIQRA